MKQFYILAATFVLAAFLFSCKQNTKQKENKAENTTSVIPAAEKAISIELKGILRTRRSYSNIQFMDDEKEIDPYLAKQGKSNPELYLPLNKEDSMWVERFERFGVIKNYTFLIKKFKTQTNNTCSLRTSLGDTIRFKFYKDTATSKMWFAGFFNGDTVNVNTDSFTPQNLDYAFLDIIPGGNKELVFLDDYYVMNGDNFNFMVYDIKTN
jgi:hypothetical protein